MNTFQRCALAAAILPAVASANVDLVFQAHAPTASIGDDVFIDIIAVSDDPDSDQAIAAIEAIITWPASSLHLIGIDGGGEADLAFESFPITGSNNLNEANPPQDGDGLYIALCQLGTTTYATREGTRITTLRFHAIAPDGDATVNVEQTGGDPERHTIVYSGDDPNTDITGQLTGATIAIPCGPADVNMDGVLDFFDAQMFLDAFAQQDPLADFATPFGTFNFFDVQEFLQAFSDGCL